MPGPSCPIAVQTRSGLELTEKRALQKEGAFALRRLFTLCLLAALSVIFLGACKQKPTIEQCRIAFANMLYLRMGKPEDPAIINQLTNSPASREMSKVCVQEKTLQQVQCEMNADSLEQIQACDRFARSKN